MLTSKVKILVLLGCMVFFALPSHAQRDSWKKYKGILEYSVPLLSAVPPVYPGQPSDITNAYLWIDQLMRSSTGDKIDNYIRNIGYGDTIKYLAKMMYRITDDNPISVFQYDMLGWPRSWERPYRWNYKADPDQERSEIQNHIGAVMGDTGRTGFILACDLITDVIVQDTIVKSYLPGNGITSLVLVTASVQDEIKGQQMPVCLQTIPSRRKPHDYPLSSGYANIYTASIGAATSGACFQFEYSPEWQKGLFNDAPSMNDYLQDSTGWWIKPNGEYILFLRIAGVGNDTANAYFSIHPFWGVFGNSGAMYRVIDGRVVDPHDDFGLGGTNLMVDEWKTRLRARIYRILNP